MNYKRIVLVTLSTSECIVAAFLGYKLYTIAHQRKNVLGTNIIRIHKSNLILPQDKELNSYYEPKPNDTQEIIGHNIYPKSTLTINSDGINSPHEYSIHKQNDTYRIVTIGDSFTLGLFVNTTDSWPYLLENDLNHHMVCPLYKKFEVLNLGVQGYDYQYALHRYIERGYKYKPNLIIFLDSGMITGRMNEVTIPVDFQCNKDFEEKNPENKTDEEIGVICDAKHTDVLQQQFSPDQFLNIQKAYWDNFFQFQDNSDVLYITYSDVSSENKARAKYFLSQRPKAFFDDSVKGLNDPNLTFPDGHPNIQGHRVLEQNILVYLKNKLLNMCSFAD